MAIEHLILRNIDGDCDVDLKEWYDYEVMLDGAVGDKGRGLWIGCGTKTVAEVAMVRSRVLLHHR